MTTTASLTSPTAAPILDEWIHIPTPGDHYSPKTGSAIITVAHEMTRWHAAAGGSSRVLVQAGTWDGYSDGARMEIHFPQTGTPSRAAKAVDSSLGAILGRRFLSGRTYSAAAAKIGVNFTGVVFVHNEPSAVEIIARRCPNAKVCLWVQNELFRTYTNTQTRRVARFAYRIIACSEYIATRIRKQTGPLLKLVTLLNGADTSLFVPRMTTSPDPIPQILFVGRMVPEKGVHLLLEAAKILQSRNVPFRLRIVGNKNFNAADALTPYELAIRSLATGLGERVEFLPFQPRAKIVELYQAADIFCVPSNWDDPCPLTIVEAMATGLAIVASRRGGIPEEGQDAIRYFSPPDCAELATHLFALLTQPQLRHSLGIAARDRSQALDWKNRYHTLQRLLQP